MKRLYVLLVVSLFFSVSASAQVFGNEWINYSQKYLKIKVTIDGIYRVDSTTVSNSLNAIGVSLSSIDPQNFQLIHNGQEEYIYVEGESDGIFNGTDFIEFYGKHNDGNQDSALYDHGNRLLNPYYSLFSDTGVYFLTWNSSTTNRRFAVANDTAFSTFTPAPYFKNVEYFIGNSAYFPGAQNSLGITDPAFISTEGFYDLPIDYGQTLGRNVYSASAYVGPGMPWATIRMRIGSHSDDFGLPGPDNEVKIDMFSTTLTDTLYDGYQVNDYSYNVDPNLLGPSYTSFNISSINPGGSVSSGRTAIAYIVLKYAHTFSMEGRTFFYGYLPDDTVQTKSYLKLTGVGGSGIVHVYDFYNHERIAAISIGPLHQVLVRNGNGSEKPFAVIDETGVRFITTMQPVNTTGQFTNYPANAVDSAFVIIAHKSLMGVAQEYKNYRASAAGGNRNVVLADVSELFDQFAYGISQDPLAMRRFADYMIHNYPSAPSQLFLMGKSIYGDYARGHAGPNMVPTFGYPACDNSITAGLNGTRWEPAIPTGRIAAQDSAQAQWYLNKVIGYESQTPAVWMKNVLHFGGGTDVSQQQEFAGYLNAYKSAIEDTLFGGVVTTFLKTSSAPIQINQSDSLRQIIENGVTLMTFFGHASGTGFDQSIDDPATYNNINRYPFILANSCYAGDIHSYGISSSEAFTLIDQKGTIGYLASVGLGIPGYLNIYSSRIYKSVGQSMYGKPIGDCIKWTVSDAQIIDTNNILLKTTLMEMTLEGDPSIILNSFPKPDYEITNADVWFDQVTQPDSVSIYAKVSNLGKAISDTMFVQMMRIFPNGDSISYMRVIQTPKYLDTLLFKIPVDQQNGIGLNHIRIIVDFTHSIDEMNENNNQTFPDVDLLIHGSAIVPVYPYEFAVIPNDTVTLKASTVNPMEPIKTYRFELDTTDLFNSSFKQTFVVTSAGGVVTWRPNLMSNDSMVYFWRVSPDSITTADVFIWRQSSFQYINNKTGWGQDHIYQYTNDNYQFVKLNRPARHFVYADDVKNISVKNGIYGYIPWNEVWYKIDGSLQHIFTGIFNCGIGGVTIAVIDPVTGLPWTFISHTPGQGPAGNCVYYVDQMDWAFDFTDDTPAGRDSIRNFLAAIPNGYKVLIYSQYYHNAQLYDASLRAELANVGGIQLAVANGVADTTAFILWGTKGGGPGNEVIAAAQNSIITLNDTFQTHWNTGKITSPVIGPAISWGSFHWKQHADENPTYDTVSVDVYGITANGTETLLRNFPKDSTDILTLGAQIDATVYPYLRLVAVMKDDTTRTPAQMDRWHVLYTPYPDVAINPRLTYSFHSDTLQEGDNAKLVVAVQNLTPWAMTDSLLLTYWLIDNNRVRHNLPQKVKPTYFNGFQWFADTVSVNTTGYAGANELWIEANPVGNVNSQLEQYHFNNVMMVPFLVGTDKINPLLDVTFDGVHIMDKDIVSGKPGILVTLKDENQFLALNDTSDFNVFLRSPSQQVAVLQAWGPNMIFVPAVLPHNSCKILFNPTCTEDGIYELIVQAKDRSSNQSGLIDYHITFEVINKPSVTNVLNYPNPFSSSTQFVFTLTGNDVPQLFTIQIMTITGKVVREISKEELGDIHIGRNITTYAWDGKDEFGDQLANGVYLYRVITRLDGDTIEKRKSGADPFINHGWGKMYLMR